MKSPIIELRNAQKVYNLGEVEVIALREATLKINKGEFVAIMGPSGSGKSTMLNMVGCLDRPTKGRILLDGTDISKLCDNKLARLRGRKIGFIFQFFNLYPTLSALENVELPMMIIEKGKKEREERAKMLLKEVGLENRIYHQPFQMSGGERQRVAIARSLANDPDLILADEPTGNLDTKTGEDVMKIFSNLNKMGKTIVFVTHEPDIANYAKILVKIKDGKVLKKIRREKNEKVHKLFGSDVNSSNS